MKLENGPLILVLLSLVLAGCSSANITTSSPIPGEIVNTTPTPSFASPERGVVGYRVGQVFYDEAALSLCQAIGEDCRFGITQVPEGWQFWIADIAIENETELCCALLRYGFDSLAVLVDSGGFERPAYFLGGQRLEDPAAIIIPHSRIRQYAYGAIPLNQTPATITLPTDGIVSQVRIDLAEQRDEISYPFASEVIPPNKGSAGGGDADGNAFYIAINDTKVLDDPEYDDWMLMGLEVELTNNGGYDLRIDDFSVMVEDDAGFQHSTQMNQWPYDPPRENIAPGMTAHFILGTWVEKDPYESVRNCV